MPVPEKVTRKLQDLPQKPGVYLMRDRSGKVIYVGKAKCLSNRVRNYFQPSTLRTADPKIRGLIRSIADFDYITVRSDADAVLTEGRLIKEYRPRYNTSFKDDKRFIMLRVSVQDPLPRISTCRIKKNDEAAYFGPYVSAASAHVAKDFVEKKYGLRQCRPRLPGELEYKHCMADIIRRCAAPCIGKISPEAYRERVEEACAFLRGERPLVLKELHDAMEQASQALDFEKAAVLRDTLLLLRKAVKRKLVGKKDMVVRGEEAREGLLDIQRALRLPEVPKVIETFDISNISGTYAVASMVVSENGFPRRNKYRQFRIKTVEGPNDPEMMAEAVHRRYRRLQQEGASFPDIVMVDGGLTQLRAARSALDGLGLTQLKVIGIAKRYEEIFWDVTNLSPPLRFPEDSPALHILQVIRDEAHRFALTYHRSLRQKRIRDSRLDDLPGIGEKRKRLLLQTFGSVDQIRRASLQQLEAVPGVGKKFAALIHEGLSGKSEQPE